RRLKLISESDSKSDRADAEMLARLGRADVKLLAPIKHRGSQAQADLAVAKARDLLVGCRTKLVNHVRSVVKCFGERLASCASESFCRLREAIPEVLRPALEPLFIALERLQEQIDGYDLTLKALAKKYPDVEILAQPHGVGTLTALVYLLTIEDKTR